MTQTAPLVRASHDAGLATLTLDSPHNRNALSAALIEQLLAALASAVTDDAVRAVVVSHSGPVFCAGADLKETAAAFQAIEETAARNQGTADSAAPPAPGAASAPASTAMPAARMGELLAAVWECPKPVLVAVAGPARAGGLGLIAAADIAVCAKDATFSFLEVRLGVVPAVISATVVPRLTPRAVAELFLTGDTFDGTRAAEIGLVTAAVPAEELDATVARYAASLLRGAPGALATAKSLARRPTATSIRAELAELTKVSVSFFTSAEGREGVRSFMEKRDPSWVRELDGRLV